MDLATDKVELTMRLDKNVDKSSLDRCGSSSRTLSSLPETEKSGRNPASAYESISDLETILLAHPARSPP